MVFLNRKRIQFALRWCVYLFGLFLVSCTAALSHLQETQHQRDFAFHELRTEIADLKHALEGYRSELQIMQERLSHQENFAAAAMQRKSHTDMLQTQLNSCEKKLMVAEKTIEIFSSDLRALHKHADQTSESLLSFKEKILDHQRELAHHGQKLESIHQLKTTLAQISQAISTHPKTTTHPYYVVKPGDTLAEIAKRHGISLNTLKRLNNLSQDKIIVGQKLEVIENGN